MTGHPTSDLTCYVSLRSETWFRTWVVHPYGPDLEAKTTKPKVPKQSASGFSLYKTVREQGDFAGEAKQNKSPLSQARVPEINNHLRAKPAT